MKRLFILLILIIAMTVSFAAIGLVVLFATGAVNNLQDVQNLLAGRKLGETEQVVTQSPPIQDAVETLNQHKTELQNDIAQLQQNAKELKQQQAKLQEDLDALQNKQGEQGTQNAEQRAARKAEVVALFNQMRPADAAAVMDNLDDDLVLELVIDMDERQGARVLTALADDQRKAQLIEKFLQTQK